MEDDQLLTVDEVAQRLSLSRSKVYELLAEGDIPSVHIGRSRRVIAKELDKWIARLKEKQHGE